MIFRDMRQRSKLKKIAVRAKSPAFRSGQSWILKIFFSVPTLVLGLMIDNFQTLSFGTPFTDFCPALTQKIVGVPNCSSISNLKLIET